MSTRAYRTIKHLGRTFKIWRRFLPDKHEYRYDITLAISNTGGFSGYLRNSGNKKSLEAAIAWIKNWKL